MIDTKVKKAFSLVEILLALGIFLIVFATVGLFAVDSIRNARSNRERFYASIGINEMSKALEIMARENWAEIFNSPTGTQLYPQFSSGEYTLEVGTYDNGGVTIYLELDDVYRDGATGNIVITGGVLDPRSKEINFTAQWTDVVGAIQTVNSTGYINDWHTFTWEQTLESEFLNGNTTDSFVVNNDDGEIQLASQVYADWCSPELGVNTFDLPGNGISKSISAIPGVAHVGTNQGSGISYSNILISDDDPPLITIPDTFTGYNVVSVHGDENYAYLATTNDSKEVVILDISSTPFTEVGHVNLSGSRDAVSIFVNNDIGYVTQHETLYTFDLSSKTGSRPIIDSHSLFRRGSFMHVRDDYAYILIAGAVEELEIIDLSNPNNLQTVGFANVNAGVAVKAITVNEAQTRAYIGANASSQYNEIFVLDIEEKTGERPIIGSFDTNGMNVTDLIVVQDDTIVISVGTNSQEYQVVDISDEANPTYCGGLEFNTGLNGIAGAVFSDTGNRYVYVVSNDPSEELKVIRGGLAGSGGFIGEGYVPEGTFDSEIFDTGVSNPYYYVLSWDETVPGTTNVRFQLRSSDDPGMSGATWVGPDGTSGTYFEMPEGDPIPGVLQNNRYLQYRAYLQSDAANTPFLNSVIINYQR